MRRRELSGDGWEFVRPLLPASLRGGGGRTIGRLLNGVVWRFRTGRAWWDGRERYGPWATPHTRFRRWAMDGTFARMLRAAQANANANAGAAGGVEWLVSVDSTVVELTSTRPGPKKGGSATRPAAAAARRPSIARHANTATSWNGASTV
ncbi:transposase [Streptomyces griseus]|uniref:transposase n=1 Tax=Streptomyces griseus TaxID=1911 RepID=UPI00382AC8E3